MQNEEQLLELDTIRDRILGILNVDKNKRFSIIHNDDNQYRFISNTTTNLWDKQDVLFQYIPIGNGKTYNMTFNKNFLQTEASNLFENIGLAEEQEDKTFCIFRDKDFIFDPSFLYNINTNMLETINEFININFIPALTTMEIQNILEEEYQTLRTNFFDKLEDTGLFEDFESEQINSIYNNYNFLRKDLSGNFLINTVDYDNMQIILNDSLVDKLLRLKQHSTIENFAKYLSDSKILAEISILNQDEFDIFLQNITLLNNDEYSIDTYNMYCIPVIANLNFIELNNITKSIAKMQPFVFNNIKQSIYNDIFQIMNEYNLNNNTEKLEYFIKLYQLLYDSNYHGKFAVDPNIIYEQNKYSKEFRQQVINKLILLQEENKISKEEIKNIFSSLFINLGSQKQTIGYFYSLCCFDDKFFDSIVKELKVENKTNVEFIQFIKKKLNNDFYIIDNNNNSSLGKFVDLIEMETPEDFDLMINNYINSKQTIFENTMLLKTQCDCFIPLLDNKSRSILTNIAFIDKSKLSQQEISKSELKQKYLNLPISSIKPIINTPNHIFLRDDFPVLIQYLNKDNIKFVQSYFNQQAFQQDLLLEKVIKDPTFNDLIKLTENLYKDDEKQQINCFNNLLLVFSLEKTMLANINFIKDNKDLIKNIFKEEPINKEDLELLTIANTQNNNIALKQLYTKYSKNLDKATISLHENSNESVDFSLK